MPSIAVSRKYEAIYILDPDSGEERVATTTARYRQLVENQGGTVDSVDVWERRKLAYPIKGKTEGIYVVMQFQGVATVETELRRIFRISEDQIRAMIVKREEGQDQPTPQPVERYSRNEPAHAPAAAPVIAAAAVVEAAPAPVEAAEAVEATEAVEAAPVEAVAATEPEVVEAAIAEASAVETEAPAAPATAEEVPAAAE